MFLTCVLPEYFLLGSEFYASDVSRTYLSVVFVFFIILYVIIFPKGHSAVSRVSRFCLVRISELMPEKLTNG